MESKDFQEKSGLSSILQINAQTTRKPATVSVRAEQESTFPAKIQKHRKLAITFKPVY